MTQGLVQALGVIFLVFFGRFIKPHFTHRKRYYKQLLCLVELFLAINSSPFGVQHEQEVLDFLARYAKTLTSFDGRHDQIKNIWISLLAISTMGQLPSDEEQVLELLKTLQAWAGSLSLRFSHNDSARLLDRRRLGLKDALRLFEWNVMSKAAILRVQWNETTRFSRLPLDIIYEIIHFTVHSNSFCGIAEARLFEGTNLIHQPVFRSFSYLRTISLKSSFIWSKIDYHSTRNARIIRELLARSDKLPLTVNLPDTAHLHLLLSALPRIQHLHIDTSTKYFLRANAPALISAKVFLGKTNRINPWGWNIFNGVTKNLRSFSSDFFPSDADPAWGRLTHLKISGAWVEQSHLNSVIDACQNLQVMVFASCRLAISANDIISANHPNSFTNPLPHLQHFVVTGCVRHVPADNFIKWCFDLVPLLQHQPSTYFNLRYQLQSMRKEGSSLHELLINRRCWDSCSKLVVESAREGVKIHASFLDSVAVDVFLPIVDETYTQHEGAVDFFYSLLRHHNLQSLTVMDLRCCPSLARVEEVLKRADSLVQLLLSGLSDEPALRTLRWMFTYIPTLAPALTHLEVDFHSSTLRQPAFYISQCGEYLASCRAKALSPLDTCILRTPAVEWTWHPPI